MKKFLLIFAAVVLTAFSADVFAQYSTGVAPYPGATHTYSVINTATSSYVWQVFKADMTQEITTFPGSGIASFTATGNSVVIKWANTAVVGDEYIVTVEETDQAGCKNSKALPVIVTASTFDLLVADGGNACYTNSVVIGWVGGQTATDVTYDHGVATITYTVQATGVGPTETWSFTPNMTYVVAGTYSQTYTVVDGTATAVIPVSGVYTLTGPQTATVTVVVDNNNSFTNASAANAQNYNATMSLTAVASGTGAIESDNTNNSDVLTVSRPNTTQISFD